MFYHSYKLLFSLSQLCQHYYYTVYTIENGSNAVFTIVVLPNQMHTSIFVNFPSILANHIPCLISMDCAS